MKEREYLEGLYDTYKNLLTDREREYFENYFYALSFVYSFSSLETTPILIVIIQNIIISVILYNGKGIALK